MSMQRYLNKRYKLSKIDNYDAYLRALRVKLFYRKMANVDRPVVRLIERDGKFVFETRSITHDTLMVFRPGVPFEENRMDGKMAKSVIDFEDNRMTHVQTSGDGQTFYVWEFSDKGIAMTLTHGDIVCRAQYDRIMEK